MKTTTYKPVTLNENVGKPLVRRGGREKVTGTATFTAEWPIEGLLYAVPVCSPIASGKFLSIDSRDAERMPGVQSIITPGNIPDFKRVATANESKFKTSAHSSLFPAAEKEIFFAGQFLAAVVADSFESARDAALLVKVETQATPHLTDFRRAEAKERPKSLMGAPPVIEIGKADDVFEACESTIDVEYELEGNYHNPIEPHATIAHWTEKDGQPFLTVYETTQSIASARNTYAEAFRLKPSQVRVICPYVGGAFGSKGLSWPQALLACFCARVVDAPVKVVMSREQMYGGTGQRTTMKQRVAIGATKDGKFKSIIHEGVAATSIRDEYAEAFTMATRMMYHTDALRLAQKQCRLNMQIPTFMRAPAETPGMFALESAVDELASRLGIDPIELRIINEPDKDVHNGKPFSGRHLVECMREGAKRFGWQDRALQTRQRREGAWLIGMGMAAATYPTSAFATEVQVTLKADGTAHIDCCTQEIGTGTETVQCQVLADLLGIKSDKVSMKLGDSDLPAGGVSGGSTTAMSVGGALRSAVATLKEKLVELTKADSPLRDADLEDIAFQSGQLVFKQEKMDWATLLQMSSQSALTVTGKMAMKQDTETANHSFGAQFVEVAVDEDFGMVRIRRMLGSFACGTILNAKTARSQFLGAMIMGVGHALHEEVKWDHRIGRITNDNIAEYHVPVCADIPDIQVMWTEEPDFNASPIGAKGIGEIGITGVAAAVANAIYNATGKRIRKLPITTQLAMR